MKITMYCLALIVIAVSMFFINVRLFASVTDDRIESAAKQSYVFKTYLKGDDIGIKSEDGVVTLTGTVSDESRKSLARETVVSLPGVRSVENKLEVKGEVLTANTDAWLITKVRSALLLHRNVNAAETEISAKDGTITLRGMASSAAQRDLTTEYAKDVEGVRKVENEMTVQTAAIKPGEKTMSEKLEAMIGSIDDASVTAMVKSTLLYHRSTSALNTTVVTKDGVVILGGRAGNAAEKELATKLVSDVYGVNRVVNHMVVRETGSKTK